MLRFLPSNKLSGYTSFVDDAALISYESLRRFFLLEPRLLRLARLFPLSSKSNVSPGGIKLLIDAWRSSVANSCL